MQTMYYIGLDVHKRMISYCVKEVSGRIYAEGSVPATRLDLNRWMKTLPQPWTAEMEATVFSGWIYDHLRPHAVGLKVAHPLMLRAIAAAKKRNDRIDAGKICDCLRCDFLPECYMAPSVFRERRRTLRYRNLLVRQMVQMAGEHNLNLLGSLGRLDSKWKAGSIWNRNQRGEANSRRENQKNLHRAPPKLVRRAFALLTKTYHGSRLTGQVRSVRSYFPGNPVHLASGEVFSCQS